MNFAQNEAPPRFELGISCLLDRRFNQLSHGAAMMLCALTKLLMTTCFVLRLKKDAPNVGLEPTTLRLRVSCSTDWASRAVFAQHRDSMRNDADVKRGPKLVKTKPTSRVCGFQLISGGMPWRRWCSGIMQDSHSCDPGSIPGRRTCILTPRVCEAG